MRIIAYEFADLRAGGMSFSKVEMGKVNLIVGDTGSGKTRFLNTIFNLGSSVTGQRQLGGPSRWELTFDHQGIQYGWQIRTDIAPYNRPIVVKEHLWQQTNSSRITIVHRTPQGFSFKDSELPKLSSDSLSISILKEEDSIRPLFEAFSLILRRYFHADALKTIMPVSVPNPEFFQVPIDNLLQLHTMDLPLNLKLYQLAKNFPEIYENICYNFTNVFSSIKDISIKDVKELVPSSKLLGPTPVLCVKEKNIKKWIGIDQLSSGMQKVLLILTDTLSLPSGGMYLIDEYENSLGVSAIDFLPSFIIGLEKDIQFIITSHHPYIINKIPVENWLVFGRKGGKVTVRYGQSNIDIYGRSKQESFIKLINDPFYSRDVD